MNSNVGIQHSGLVAWDGLAATPRDIRKHNQFGFVFEVTGVIAVDAVFQLNFHAPDVADNCAPGDAVPSEAIAICQTPAEGAMSQFIIPAGTPVGSVCAGAPHCREGAFVSLSSVSGDTDEVTAVLILSGPRI